MIMIEKDLICNKFTKSAPCFPDSFSSYSFLHAYNYFHVLKELFLTSLENPFLIKSISAHEHFKSIGFRVWDKYEEDVYFLAIPLHLFFLIPENSELYTSKDGAIWKIDNFSHRKNFPEETILGIMNLLIPVRYVI